MFFYNFGLEGYLSFFLYAAGIISAYLSFKRPKIGLFYLIPLLPLQTIRYRMDAYPLGGSMVTIILLSVTVGLLLKNNGEFVRSSWNVLFGIYGSYQFGTLIIGIGYLPHMPLDITIWRFRDWTDYMMMPLLLLVVAGAINSRRDMKILLVLMFLGIFAVDKSFWSAIRDRDFSSYSDDMRESGPLGQAGANGLGAFEAQSAMLAIIMARSQKRWWRLALYLIAGFSTVCLLYSFSRGAYLAFAAGCLFVGIVRQRILLVALLVAGFGWATLAPTVVQERVAVTQEDGELDHSSEIRVDLWRDALELASQNIIFGTGYNTYRFMERVSGFFGAYNDTHNIYLKVLVETGAIGLLLFLVVLGKAFATGYHLYSSTQDDFLSSIGLSLAGWVICSAVANAFGDRWTFFQVNGFMWVLAGLATKAVQLKDKGDTGEDGINRTRTDRAYTGLLPASLAEQREAVA